LPRLGGTESVGRRPIVNEHSRFSPQSVHDVGGNSQARDFVNSRSTIKITTTITILLTAEIGSCCAAFVTIMSTRGMRMQNGMPGGKKEKRKNHLQPTSRSLLSKP